MNETTRGATMRCREALDVLSLPKKDFAVLAMNLPEVRRSFDTSWRSAICTRRQAPAPPKSSNRPIVKCSDRPRSLHDCGRRAKLAHPRDLIG